MCELLVRGLLTASEALSTRVLAEHAGISTETIRRHRDDFEAIGLLTIENHGPGQATLYQLRLPFRAERDDAAAPCPIQLVTANGETQAQSIRDVVCDLLDVHGCLDEAFADQTISNGRVGWPLSIAPAVEHWPWLRPWIDVIVRLVGIESGGSLNGPSQWIDGPFARRSRFGQAPSTQ